MKRWMACLLVCVLLGMCCAAAEGGVGIQDMASANELAAVLSGMKGLGMNCIVYDAAGAEFASVYSCAWKTPDGQILYASEDSNGSIMILGDGEGYGFHAPNMQFYLMGFIGDAYEREMKRMYDTFILKLDGDETPLRTEPRDGRVVLTTTEQFKGTWYENAYVTLETEYCLNADTLLVEEIYEYGVDEQGARTLMYKVWATPDVVYDIPEEFSALDATDNLRVVHVIENPGRENEFDHVFELPGDVLFQIMPPEGYAGYADPACTRVFPSPAPGEADEQPAETVIFMGLQDTLVGSWASLGSQDSLPYLLIKEDGTLEAFDYDGNSLQKGVYTFDQENSLFTFPDGEQWTLMFETVDREMLLSTSMIGDDPVPLGTRMLSFTRESTDDFDDGWIAYACVPGLPVADFAAE